MWFAQHGLNDTPGCILRTNQGGELAGSSELLRLCARHGYMVELTGKDASSQNGLAESPHRRAGEMVRALLDNANLPTTYWPYALLWWAMTWNITYKKSIDALPFTVITGVQPNLTRLRVWGSKVYARKPGQRTPKLSALKRHLQFLVPCRQSVKGQIPLSESGCTISNRTVPVSDDGIEPIDIVL